MDTSEQYIKMCKEAKEVQGLAIPLGIRKPNYQSQCGADMSESGDWWHLNTWLPRQDQLQGMTGYIYDIQMIRDFLDFITSPLVYETINGTHYYKLNSMEQLWLAFVMKEKYGKVWDGETWKKL